MVHSFDERDGFTRRDGFAKRNGFDENDKCDGFNKLDDLNAGLYGEGSGTESNEPGPRLVLFLTASVQLGYAVMAILNLLKWQHGSLSILSAVAVLTVFFALQLFHCNPYTIRLRSRVGPYTLGLQAVFAYAPIPMSGVLWGGFGGFLSGSFLVVLRGSVLAWVLYLVNSAAVFVLALVRFSPVEAAYLTLASLIIGLMVYGLTRLSDLVVAQRRLRERTTWVAVSGERLRFARDLHDLLGYSLSAITLKSELTIRQVGVDDDRARQELTETLDISRQALADVRAVVSGYREMSFTDELRSVVGVLHTAGVDTVVKGAPRDTDPRIGTILAIVLREAVTNLLRHSHADRCRIEFVEERGRIVMTISNDGARDADLAAGARRRTGGLGNLADRLSAVGGSLSTSGEWGWFRLRASCPLQPPPRGAWSKPRPPGRDLWLADRRR
ncbi:histidine kinase [Streptomyces sp. NBC_01511]|uniref:sensor histidine kinase n=1 Tax=unclassified Streptomyces TaxID=2593676 RepID=UPI0038645F84